MLIEWNTVSLQPAPARPEGATGESSFLGSLRSLALERSPCAPAAEPFAGLATGARGAVVARLQRVLTKWNPRLGVTANGIYDQATSAAVQLFQAIYGKGGRGSQLEPQAAAYLRQMEDGSFWDNPPAKTPAQAMLYHASRKLGVPYVMGGDGVGSTDCGMLTGCALKAAGVDKQASRLADAQFQRAERRGQLVRQPRSGDLVFFRVPTSQSGEAYSGVTHVGLYVGHGQMLAASSSAGKVILQRVSDLSDYLAGYARTVPP